jgi:hypothetical protein
MRAHANAGRLWRMGMLPKLSGSDLVRTDFTDDSAWDQVSGEAQQETADGFRAYVEPVALGSREHPILVVDAAPRLGVVSRK